MPISTAISEVMANQSRVFHASFAAFDTWRRLEMELTTATGRTNKVHGDIICMGITGNTARIGGQITKLWVNNVQVPIAGPTHNHWVVVDNGQGQATPDLVSLMQYTIAPGAQAHCATGLPSFVSPNQEGEVLVQP